MKRWMTGLLGIALFGCPSDPGRPKTEQPLGTYGFHATGIFASCSLPTPPAEYDFEGTFSRQRDGGAVFFIADGVTYDAGFDGQLASFDSLDTRGIGLRDGGSCSPCKVRSTQLGNIVLLSPSQNAAVGDACPTAALDGGVPRPNPDAGIALPQSLSDGGFDAVRACGEVEVNVTSEGFCDQACYSCKLTYRWAGARKK